MCKSDLHMVFFSYFFGNPNALYLYRAWGLLEDIGNHVRMV